MCGSWLQLKFHTKAQGVLVQFPQASGCQLSIQCFKRLSCHGCRLPLLHRNVKNSIRWGKKVLALNEVQSDCHLPGRFVMVCAFCAPVGDEMRTSWHKFNSSNLLPETIDHCSSSLIQCTNISTASAGLVQNIMLCLPVHQTTVSARPTSQNWLHNTWRWRPSGSRWPLGRGTCSWADGQVESSTGKDGWRAGGWTCQCHKTLQGRNGSATSDTMRQAGEERLAVVCGGSMTWANAGKWAELEYNRNLGVGCDL